MNTDTRLAELEFHSLANIFPMMDAESLQSLSDDIKQHGLHESILVYEGKILDGRNRYRACNMAGVDPDFDTYDGDDPLSFVISRNLKRRQLTPGQLAFVALKIKDIEAERAKERQRVHGGTAPGKKANTAANLGGSVASDARDLAAKQVGVSHGYVTDAEKVRREAPELENKVVAGEVTLPQALREIKERVDELRTPPATGNHRAKGNERKAAEKRKASAPRVDILPPAEPRLEPGMSMVRVDALCQTCRERLFPHEYPKQDFPVDVEPTPDQTSVEVEYEYDPEDAQPEYADDATTSAPSAQAPGKAGWFTETI
jgi:ParB-like chromosome segregation protein Spo0J